MPAGSALAHCQPSPLITVADHCSIQMCSFFVSSVCPKVRVVKINNNCFDVTLRVPSSPPRQQWRLTCRSGSSHDELVLSAYLIMCIVYYYYYYYYYALQLASSVIYMCSNPSCHSLVFYSTKQRLSRSTPRRSPFLPSVDRRVAVRHRPRPGLSPTKPYQVSDDRIVNTGPAYTLFSNVN